MYTGTKTRKGNVVNMLLKLNFRHIDHDKELSYYKNIQ